MTFKNTRPCPQFFCPLKGVNKNLTVNTKKQSIFCLIKQQGVTLVELMIALGIGTLIALAISTLFFQVFSGYRTVDDGARAMEGGSFGLRVLTEDLRMAGFAGLFNDAARIQVARADMISGSASDNCGSQQWFLPYNATSGQVNFLEHIATPTDLSCIPSGSYAAGSPAIVIRGATGVQATAADYTSNKIFLQSSQSGAIVFMGKDYATEVKAADRQMKVCNYVPGASACTDTGDTPPCRCPKTGANANKGTVSLIEGPANLYHAHIYYIRPCSRPAGTTCTASDDGGQPIPTLVRRQLTETDPAFFIETPIAEGVERMAVSYGLDTNSDGVPDTYTDSATVFTASSPDLSRALTVRVSLLMRTRKPENNYTDTATYTLADGSTFKCTGASCMHHRYLLTDTVQLKNYVIR